MEEQTPKRRRVNVACFSCRSRKSRCSGQRPKCNTCIELGLTCQYVSSGQSSETIVVGKEHFQAIEDRLNQLESRLQHSHNPPVTPARSEDVSDGFGSLVFGDEEDRAYFGPSSNVAFTSDISRALKRLSRNRGEFRSSSRHMLVDFHITRVSENSPAPRTASWTGDSPQGEVSIFYLPPDEETSNLIDIYWSNNGMLCPYLHEETFRDKYAQLKHNSTATRRTWLGLLNIVLALATYASTQSGSIDQRRSAEEFYQRANKLCGNYVMKGASLEIVQYLLLASQYMQVTQSSMQAWSMHGLAVKAALQLGLHSSEAAKRYSPVEREIRKRTWFGCIVLDRTLSMTLGRPSTIPEHYCRLELPGYFDLVEPRERQIEARRRCRYSTDFFSATIRLYCITGKVLDQLYDNNLGLEEKLMHYEIVTRVLRLRHLLEEWVPSVPAHMALIKSSDCTGQLGRDRGIDRFRLILTLRYYNVRLLINRTVLVRLCEGMDDHAVQSHDCLALQDIARSTVQMCVESATEIINILRIVVESERQQQGLLGFWWFALYYTFDAALVIFTIFLLEKHSTCVAISPLHSTDSLKHTFLSCIGPLRRLDEGNRTIDRCCRCLEALAEAWNTLETKTLQQGVPGQEDPVQETLSLMDFDFMADTQYGVTDGFLSNWGPEL
ncbi:Zn(II)2Cys6 transcription factor [Aspergillus stella-maris]|uniref:Zn(II)2Cys6 transcription factor n=1 Tax=Aspergillus stella-maris TaxID=1810926 RepID=UPI003CCD1E4D